MLAFLETFSLGCDGFHLPQLSLEFLYSEEFDAPLLGHLGHINHFLTSLLLILKKEGVDRYSVSGYFDVQFVLS